MTYLTPSVPGFKPPRLGFNPRLVTVLDKITGGLNFLSDYTNDNLVEGQWTLQKLHF